MSIPGLVVNKYVRMRFHESGSSAENSVWNLKAASLVQKVRRPDTIVIKPKEEVEEKVEEE